ncbi:MAG: gph [Sphingomonas bacterium]|uniref:HAD hydrolase-like protein n=1 Tax=Sphingomonas bacterium TaxID=1895847 RepID=UPI00261DCD6A|nr:HAD hydrolase-like protein [Sphingomonas bacterium]MDB5707297.1 gph [Sphingomonas bacterium]
MTSYDLAIFDFDGTLADSAPWFIDILNDIADRFGFRQASREEIELLRSCNIREIIRRLEVPAWTLPYIARHMRQRAAADADRIGLFPGTWQALIALKEKGVDLAIVSSNAEANIRGTLGRELAGLVAFYGCGSSLFGKAAKIRQAVKQCGAARARAIYIGDEMRDVEAARAAGIASGAVTWGYAAPAALAQAGPTLTFRQMSEIACL